MTSRALAAMTLVALSLAACGHGPQDGPGAPGAPGGPGGPGGPGRARGGPPPGEPGPQRPRLQLFISPAGEPFRAPADAPYPVAAWFAGADANHDGALSRDEFVADAARFFAVLDADHDEVIDGFEVSTYEKKIAPEILLGGMAMGGGGPDGGGRRPPRRPWRFWRRRAGRSRRSGGWRHARRGALCATIGTPARDGRGRGLQSSHFEG